MPDSIPVSFSATQPTRHGCRRQQLAVVVLAGMLCAVSVGCRSVRTFGLQKQSRATNTSSTVTVLRSERSQDLPAQDLSAPAWSDDDHPADHPADVVVQATPGALELEADSSERAQISADVPGPGRSQSTIDYDPEVDEPEVGEMSLLDNADVNANLPLPQLDFPKLANVLDSPPAELTTAEPSPAELSRSERPSPEILTALDAVNLVQELNGSVQADELGRVTGVDLSFREFTSTQLKALRLFDSLQQLDLTGTAVTDDDLLVAGQLPRLRALRLTGTPVTDQALTSLSQLSELQLLDLSKTAVTDNGLRQLTQLRSLKFLSLNSTAVSDESLNDLRSMRQLRGLSVVNTSISGEGIRALRAALPDCVVVDGARASRQSDAQRMLLVLHSPWPEDLIDCFDQQPSGSAPRSPNADWAADSDRLATHEMPQIIPGNFAHPARAQRSAYHEPFAHSDLPPEFLRQSFSSVNSPQPHPASWMNAVDAEPAMEFPPELRSTPSLHIGGGIAAGFSMGR